MMEGLTLKWRISTSGNLFSKIFFVSDHQIVYSKLYKNHCRYILTEVMTKLEKTLTETLVSLTSDWVELHIIIWRRLFIDPGKPTIMKMCGRTAAVRPRTAAVPPGKVIVHVGTTGVCPMLRWPSQLQIAAENEHFEVGALRSPTVHPYGGVRFLPVLKGTLELVFK